MWSIYLMHKLKTSRAFSTSKLETNRSFFVDQRLEDKIGNTPKETRINLDRIKFNGIALHQAIPFFLSFCEQTYQGLENCVPVSIS